MIDPFAIVKWVAGLLLAGLIFFGGRACGQQDSAEDLQEKDRALIEAATDLQNASESLKAAGAALEAVNAQAELAKKVAAEQVQQAAEAVVAAEEAGKKYARRLGEMEAELEAAKADPDCRRILEAKACAALH